MTKKFIAFDLDDTLAVTKSQISDQIRDLLIELLKKYDVCIISGGLFKQFFDQVIDRLHTTDQNLLHLHIMPTCGTRYYNYDIANRDWKLQYSNDLSDDQKARATNALEASAKQLGYWIDNSYGDIIEDRMSQITYSALGQKAPATEKYKWDPTGEKKLAMRDMVAKLLPDLEVRAGGSTSVDVTLTGIDKAYGMNKLIETQHIGKDQILYLGDKLQEGGNDYPVKAMGIDTIEVNSWQDTALVIEGILGVS
jgi:HAD superfamily hydrolase (TIGR01484 family)